MEWVTANRKYDTALENQGSADQGRTEAAAAAQDPVNGLNRAISVDEGKSFSEALDESKTSHKRLYDRICDLWLLHKIRKIIGLFRKLFTCSRKETCSRTGVVSASEETGKLMNIRECTALAYTLFYKVHALVETVEKQDPSLDRWAENQSRLEEFSAELTQLKKNISDLKSRQSDYDTEEMDHLVEREIKIKSYIDWLRFYFVYGKKNDYRERNVKYFVRMLDVLFIAARTAMEGHDELLAEIAASHSSAMPNITKRAGTGQTFTALIGIGEFRSFIHKHAVSVDRLDAFEIEEKKLAQPASS